MNLGFSTEEYERVRDWLIAAMQPDPSKISEDTLIEKLGDGEWTLITTEHAASVIQLCEYEDEKIANVLLIGGERNKALREIMVEYSALCDALKGLGYTKITGQPRKEFHALLKRNGFQKGNEQEELVKEL